MLDQVVALGLGHISEVKLATGGILVPFKGRQIASKWYKFDAKFCKMDAKCAPLLDFATLENPSKYLNRHLF
jgi:hypothetical protein